jgi:murein DD-endopeptidase MepM/ murein hydrolase activator NlpD
MPEGEPVHAARSGRVVSTYDQAQGVADDGSVTANHVWIQHEDGTIGKYLHLQTAGVMVEEGAMVSAGQFIGFSGNTGFSRGPHLHFSVSTLGGDALYQTFNLRFATREGVQTLVSGRQYAHGTLPLQAP